MAERELHSEIERRFAIYMATLGYPNVSLLHEPAIASATGRKVVRPDFAVVDTETEEWLALVEVKGSLTRFEPRQLRDYEQAITPPIPVFLTVPQNDGTFAFHKLDRESGLEEVPVELFPKYLTLSAGRQAQTKTAQREDRKRVLDHFKIACFSLGFLALTGFILDLVFDGSVLSPERLSLIAIGFACVIIPYAQKIKLFGNEFVRHEQSERKDSS